MRAAFFDIDGTLVDSNELHVAAWEKAFGEAGLTPGHDAIAGQIGKGGDKLVPALAPDLDARAQERIADRHGEIFKADGLERVRSFPAARDVLVRARAAELRVVLASSASQEELDHYLDLLDAHDLVDATTTIDDVEESKPAPDIFATALKKVGLDGDDVAVIGDTPYDMDAATKIGATPLGVRSGGVSDAALREAGAAAIWNDVAALLEGWEESPLAG